MLPDEVRARVNAEAERRWKRTAEEYLVKRHAFVAGVEWWLSQAPESEG